MKPDRVTSKMKLLGVGSERKATLGAEFQATMDGGKHHFTKHFTQVVRVEDPEVYERLSTVQPGTVLRVTVREEWEKDFGSYLEDFELV